MNQWSKISGYVVSMYIWPYISIGTGNRVFNDLTFINSGTAIVCLHPRTLVSLVSHSLSQCLNLALRLSVRSQKLGKLGSQLQVDHIS